MAARRKALFKLIVSKTKEHPLFRVLRTRRVSAPARWMLSEVYQTFHDADGNFLEQFQSSGFNTRYFELYLHAYFSRSGYLVDRSKPYPDFIVSAEDVTVAVEATTVNPSTSGVLAAAGKKIKDLAPEELLAYQQHELAIRFGSPLTSKLAKRYWEHEHCRGMPFVIAIEAFHDEGALGFTDHALARYVFGIDHSATWTSAGKLRVRGKKVKEHTLGEKTIPSGFFALPGAENVSAVLFTNSGTNAKFTRMGFQHGKGNDTISVIRSGYAYDPHPDSRDASYFTYNLDHPPFVESWGQGLVVLHNPNCLHPIPKGFFVDAVDSYVIGKRVAADVRGFHPMASKTHSFDLGKAKAAVRGLPIGTMAATVSSLNKREFQAIVGVNHDQNPLFEEMGWYADDTTSFIGVLLRDRVDADWACVLLARDLLGRFRAIETKNGLPSRETARETIYGRIIRLLSSPKRYFDQGDELEQALPTAVS